MPDQKFEGEQAETVLATINDTPVEEANLLSDEQRAGLGSWARMVGSYDAPLPIRFSAVEGGWLYASVGIRFQLILDTQPTHLLILRTVIPSNIECYCICGLNAVRTALPDHLYFFQLDILHFDMYAALRRAFYQRYGPKGRGLPPWVVEELAAAHRFAVKSL
jgi:hypothetical protein